MSRFLQSRNDFPLTVSLDETAPTWGLSRWNGGGLRFLPPDEEGFTLRGDRWRLVYKGRRCSHRFTILGDTAFEYDCILEKEPESNVISLLMEGAERFDFFRQPDFVKDPFLKGSYAVYKKETLVGEGTGKLCHIHRPEIIDSRGRRCWGDLSVIGNELCITIPENFLSEAKYPVIVDPTIGATTVGSQTTGPDPDNDEYDRPMLDGQMSLNRYTAAQGGGGTCTAYVYCYYDDTDSFVLPGLYTDTNSKPHLRKSRNEHEINAEVYDYTYNGVRYYKQEGWRNSTFEIDGTITAGQPVWFGVMASWFTTRFDYGGVCYKLWPDWDSYPDGYDSDLPPVIEIGSWDTYCTIKWSWYFNYTASQNHTRTLTQGVRLTDSRKVAGGYKRTVAQTVRGTTAVTGLETFYRSLVQTVKNTMTVKASPTLIRKLIQQAGASDGAKRFLSMLRKPTQTAGINSGTQRITQAKRFITNTGKAETVIGRKQDFTRNIAHTENAEAVVSKKAGYVKRFEETAGSTGNTGVVRDVVLRIVEAVAALYEMKAGTGFSRSVTDTVKNSSVMGGMIAFFRILSGYAESGDSTGSFITRMRVIQDTGTVGDDIGHTADYLRGLFAEAGTIAETKHRAEYHRKQQDTAYNEAVPLRHLFIFIRLITGAYIRDFIIERFLKSREELVIKSPVCRELILDSRLH